MKTCILLSMICCLTFISQPACAESLPQPRIASMCESAALIVEGTWEGADKVLVTRIWKSPPDFPGDTKQISVNGLTSVSRHLVGDFPDRARQPIETKKVTLFLDREKKMEGWSPLDTMAQGSCGVFWWDDKTCYGYMQLMNPGHYYLVAGTEPSGLGYILGLKKRAVVGPEELRKSIESGLDARARFAAVLAMPDPAKRARFLVRYLVPRDTPDPTDSHKQAAEKALASLKKEAVPALVAAIEVAPPDEEFHDLFRPLYQMGADAADATPVLLRVLERKDGNAISALSVLERLGDRATIPQIRPCLRSTDSQVRFAAASALAKFDDKESFDAIARLIPSPVQGRNMHDVVSVLNQLHTLDPERTRPIALRIADDPNLAQVREQIKSLQNK